MLSAVLVVSSSCTVVFPAIGGGASRSSNRSQKKKRAPARTPEKAWAVAAIAVGLLVDVLIFSKLRDDIIWSLPASK